MRWRGELLRAHGASPYRRDDSRRAGRCPVDPRHGVNIHALLMPRAGFRKLVEGSVHNSFMHSFLTKGRLLYTHDETIADLCTTLGAIGDRDTQVQTVARRSNPATYVGFYDTIRDLFTATPVAAERAYKAGRFSFNVKGGQCEECQGKARSPPSSISCPTWR